MLRAMLLVVVSVLSVSGVSLARNRSGGTSGHSKAMAQSGGIYHASGNFRENVGFVGGNMSRGAAQRQMMQMWHNSAGHNANLNAPGRGKMSLHRGANGWYGTYRK